MNDTYDRKKRLSIDNDIMISEAHELSPLIGQRNTMQYCHLVRNCCCNALDALLLDTHM